MITVEEARARILAPLRRTGVETVSLAQGLGRVLAVPVRAQVDAAAGGYFRNGRLCAACRRWAGRCAAARDR